MNSSQSPLRSRSVPGPSAFHAGPRHCLLWVCMPLLLTTAFPTESAVGQDNLSDAVAAEATTSESAGRPAELVPLVRFRGNLNQLQQIASRGDLTVGHKDWHKNAMAVAIVDEIEPAIGDAIRDAVGNARQFTVTYELLMAMPEAGSFDPEMAVIVVFPFGREQMKKLADLGLEDTSEDAEGFGTLDELSFLYGDDYSAIFFMEGELSVSDSRSLLKDAVARAQKSALHHACDVTLEPRQIASSLRKPFLNALTAVLNADAQQRDGEDALPFRLREIHNKSMVQLLDVVFNQTHKITWALEFNEASRQVSWLLDLEAVPNSDLDAWINRQHDIQSRSIALLHPEHVFFASFAVAIPDTIRQCLPPLGDAVADAMGKSMVVSEFSAGKVRQLVRSIANGESLELLVQVVPDAVGRLMIFITFPLPPDTDLTSTTIELVSATSDTRWQISDREIDGWPVHVYPDAVPPFLAPRFGHDLQLIATDRHVTLHLTTPEARSVLREVVRHEYDLVDAARRFRRCGLSLQVGTAAFLRAVGFDDDGLRVLIGDLSASGDNPADRMTLRMDTEKHRIRVHAEFEERAMIAGTTGFSQLVLFVLEAAGEAADIF